MKTIEQAAQEYKNSWGKFERTDESYYAFIEGATSNAAKEYWYKEFEKDKIRFAIEQLYKFREATFGKGVNVIRNLEQKLKEYE